jgi:ABC-type sugar transport system permease subunit
MAVSLALPRRRTRHRPAWAISPHAGQALILPMLAGLTLFQFYPVAVAAAGSFQSFNPFTGAAEGFAGFANYRTLFQDPAFLAALRNTILYVALTIVVEIPLAIGLAQLINSRLPGTGLLRITVIAALAASETVAVLVWNRLYDPTHGLFNSVLHLAGISSQPFLTSASQALPSIVLMSVWKNAGLAVLIFLAGLQNVPAELHEAASIDGAGPFRRFGRITWPFLRRYVVVALFVSTISATRVFTPVILMTQGGPDNGTTNLTYYTYQQAFEFSQYGIADAATVVLIAILSVVTLMQALALRDRR